MSRAAHTKLGSHASTEPRARPNTCLASFHSAARHDTQKRLDRAYAALHNPRAPTFHRFDGQLALPLLLCLGLRGAEGRPGTGLVYLAAGIARTTAQLPSTPRLPSCAPSQPQPPSRWRLRLPAAASAPARRPARLTAALRRSSSFSSSVSSSGRPSLRRRSRRSSSAARLGA